MHTNQIDKLAKLRSILKKHEKKWPRWCSSAAQVPYEGRNHCSEQILTIL